MDAMANACSNFFYLWHRDSAVYQAAPLCNFPLGLGMVETLEMTRVPCECTALLQSFNGTSNCCSGGMNCCCSGGMNATMGECHFVLSILVIRRRETATAIAIKACC
jgi:hypothetical protein